MRALRQSTLGMGLLVLGATLTSGIGASHSDEKKADVAPPLSPDVQRGITWLVASQLPNGGWGQGDQSHQNSAVRQKQHSAGPVEQANVGDTAVAVSALLRAGSSPSGGEHAEAVWRGVEFICQEIERTDRAGLEITAVEGTRLQHKLGRYVDTFLTSVTLAEVKGTMPDAKSEKRLERALATVLDKIARHQKEDGTWGGAGWAPVLAQSLVGRGINRAVQNGVPVDRLLRERTEKFAKQQFDAPSGDFADAGSAGVQLYASTSSLSVLQETANANDERRDQLEKVVAAAANEASVTKAKRELDEIEETESSREAVQKAIVGRLDDPQFVAGFGSNGGEEFLSYLNISESLFADGGEAWQRWNSAMSDNLKRVQNPDGSWSGHHCITGRTFCTSSALLVLMADRMPAAKPMNAS